MLPQVRQGLHPMEIRVDDLQVLRKIRMKKKYSVRPISYKLQIQVAEINNSLYHQRETEHRN